MSPAIAGPYATRARWAAGCAAGAVLLAALPLGCISRPPQVPPTTAPPPEAVPAPESQAPLIHEVRRGETVYSIARSYGISTDALARENGIRDPRGLAVGQQLRITGVARPLSQRVSVSAGARNTWGAIDPRGRTAGVPRFAWPLEGQLSSGFGFRSGAHHDGLDILARTGTPIRAAESGRVIHADDSLAGYGNMIIIKHAGRFSTVYAHNRRNLVRAGDFVERGQAIAEVGRSGRATAPHLHFEVRENGAPRDPLHYLR